MNALQCENVSLRALNSSDIEFLNDVENDVKEWRHSEYYQPFGKDVLKAYVSGSHDIVKHGQYRFIIEEKISKSPIGCLDLFNFNPIQRRAGMGIYIQKNSRRKGFASEAIKKSLEYCSEVLLMELIYCSTLESNKGSIKLFDNAGFYITGKRENWHKDQNGREDVILMQRNLPL